MYKVFGLTGGIGTGKSTVSNIWREAGILIVDADELAKFVVRPGSEGLSALVDEFGEGILNGHELDRKALAEIIFFNSKDKEVVESILHPMVRELAKKKFVELGAEHPLICYDCPLFFESQLQNEMRPVVVVSCDESLQVKRVTERNYSWSYRQIKARIDSQVPLSDKVSQADFVIDNSSTLNELKSQSLQVLEDVRKFLTSAY